MIRKRLISTFSAIALVLSLFTFLPEGALSVQALEYGYFEYELRDGGTAAITGYNGSGKEIVIPSKIGENTVTKIGNSSFINNSDLTGVTLPSGLKTIENYAFSKCTNLKKIVIPDTVTNICYEAFAKCESLTEVNTRKKCKLNILRCVFVLRKSEKHSYPRQRKKHGSEGVFFLHKS